MEQKFNTIAVKFLNLQLQPPTFHQGEKHLCTNHHYTERGGGIT
jgi:hypothetical protein